MKRQPRADVETIIKVGAVCNAHADELNGLTQHQAIAAMRAKINGAAVSDGVLLRAIKSCGVQLIRKKRVVKQPKRFAAILLRLAAAVESSIGAGPDSLLSEEDRKYLESNA